MSAERWRPIKGCEGSYEVSDAGRVRSLDRVVNGRVRYGRVLKQRPIKHGGYLVVSISIDGKSSPKYVSRLVAQAFVPKPNLLPDVRHLNGDILDNRAENLAWAERNVNDAENWSERRSRPVVRSDGATFPSATAAAREVGVSTAAVVAACRRGGVCRGYRFWYSDDVDGRPAALGGAWSPLDAGRVERFSGEKMIRIMRERGMLVTDMARVAGISVTSLYRIRSGRIKPTESAVRKIARSLYVKPESLLEDE